MAHRPRKRFGQNFLIDAFYQQKIADSLQHNPNTSCIEIGPGKGAITAYLLQRFPHITAIELDRDLAALLRRQFPESTLTIHQKDVLKIDFEQFAIDKKLSIIGNLPYNISSPLLFKLLVHLDIIEQMVFMLQKEVVDRIVAKPGNKIYGRLSIMMGLFVNSEKLFNVPPGAFHPAPKVTSSVVRLIPRQDRAMSCDQQLFAKIVQSAFSKRRKTLRNALSTWIDGESLKKIDIDPSCRAEQLEILEFVRITQFVQNNIKKRP